LKLSQLFAKYLYQHKQLNLPGIGVFTLDHSAAIPEATDKSYHEIPQHIRFNQKNISKPDDELVDFIRTHTGKIKPLAESDIESFLSEGKILLNIGKPFHLEGIGTLLKSQSGGYEFNPGVQLAERLENIYPEKDSKTSAKQSLENEYTGTTKGSGSGSTAWVVLAILVGLTAIIWGGYTLYNRNTDNEGVNANDADTRSTVTAIPDTTQIKRTDSSAIIPGSSQVASSQLGAGIYKFIFRTARNKNYVIKRYNELKLSTKNLYWDTKDSIVYRLYLALPAAPSDTARIRDSLEEWYATKRVIIEQ
jgi:hypothetical protein